MAGRESTVRAEGIRKSYHLGRTEVPVLKGIDLTVYKGEFLVIVGPSGVGKSTLLHILGGLDRPTSGKVYLEEAPLFNRNDMELANIRNKSVGFVFQFHHLLPEFTAIENVALPGLIAGRPRTECFEKAASLLKGLNLQERSEHKPSELSGGEQQRVAVARAMINEPQIILADEPSGNLDIQSSRSLHDLLKDLCRQKNQTIVVATHNLELAGQADRIVEMYDGIIKNDTAGTL